MSVELDETAPASRESGPLPQRISKYELGERLGSGGNGVVMLARDVTLDRKVAIKLLRGDASEAASQRLQREAQAAAKLAHENVIVVHEVGTYDGSVFVAMEYVEGGTLRDIARTRNWREVLDAYRRAGRGLAAAHAAGLVHRDFKPDNVLVGNDGRVRVSDFGLVSVSGTNAVSVGSLDGTALNSTLTRTGTVMGTPRYMAPEQHDGSEVDARADQFAFCVALYEALFHRLPFEGETYETIAAHVCEGEIVKPPADSPVPREIREAVVRGLATKPADRWPSMTELLAALDVKPRRPVPWLVAIPAVLLVAALAAFFVERSRHTAEDAAAAKHARDIARINELVGPPKPVPAGAIDSDDPKVVMTAAEAAYNNGDFPTAIAGFKRAYLLDPNLDKSAPYFYDIGQAYRQWGHCAEASVAYKHYLQLRPETKQRAAIESLIQQMDDCVAQQGSATR